MLSQLGEIVSLAIPVKHILNGLSHFPRNLQCLTTYHACNQVEKNLDQVEPLFLELLCSQIKASDLIG